MLTVEKKRELTEKARYIRKNVLLATHRAQSGHPGASLSITDILVTLYFNDLRYNPQDPAWLDRDRVVLSKGHAAPALYAVLAEAGFFEEKELWHLRKINCLLQGHPCRHIPGVDLTTGSLGLGLSGACGMALGAKMTGRTLHVYAIIGDGEQDEGQIWEAAMSAAHFQLNNLTVILDRNQYQNDGPTETSMKLEPLADKWRSFGFHTVEIDGHDFEQISEALATGRRAVDAPTMIIAHTVKGKGASYLLGKPGLHYTPPTKEQVAGALQELGYALYE